MNIPTLATYTCAGPHRSNPRQMLFDLTNFPANRSPAHREAGLRRSDWIMVCNRAPGDPHSQVCPVPVPQVLTMQNVIRGYHHSWLCPSHAHPDNRSRLAL